MSKDDQILVFEVNRLNNQKHEGMHSNHRIFNLLLIGDLFSKLQVNSIKIAIELFLQHTI